MLAFPKELLESPPELLLALIESYYVKLHDGSPLHDTNNLETIYKFILDWTEPDQVPIQKSNYIGAIKTGNRFALESPDHIQKLTQELFGSFQEDFSDNVIDDLSKYPMRKFFNEDPWVLFQGWLQSNDRDSYFQEVTSENPDNFLNSTEKLFYLTHGYGRPNKYISGSDLSLRNFIKSAEPSSLIVLMDILNICPARQIPSLILEKLSEIDLKSIDPFHQNILKNVSECMKGAICTNQGCSPDKVKCLQSSLRELGILDTVEYNPSVRVYMTNLSQLKQYEKVIPNKKWDLEQIKDLSNESVSSHLLELPDSELLEIQSMNGEMLINRLDLSQLKNRFRSRLVAEAKNFLLEPKYFVDNGKLVYGRFIDSTLPEVKIESLEESVLNFKALIDPNDRPIDPSVVQELNALIRSPVLEDEIIKTKTKILQNSEMVTRFKGNEDLISKIQDYLKENGKGSWNSFDEVFGDFDGFGDLILYTGDSVPVAMSIENYLKFWSPRLGDILIKTLEHYSQVLQD